MLRRQARLRREFIYKKAVQQQERMKQSSRDAIKEALDKDSQLPTKLFKNALDIHNSLPWEGDGVDDFNEDNEYRWAGVEDPKIIVSTSRDPSSKLKQFAKEIRLIFPNSQRINRGDYDMKQLLQACRANDVTDLIMLEETRGNPDCMVICHLPYGPTAYFNLSSTVMRHDIPDVGTMSEMYPHLIFDNFSSKLGKRVKDILRYLFPVPKEDSRRLMTFSNTEDYISFRHHTYKKIDGKIELMEVGPRFEMKIFKIILGTLDTLNISRVEWVFKPYMNTTRKRQFLSEAMIN